MNDELAEKIESIRSRADAVTVSGEDGLRRDAALQVEAAKFLCASAIRHDAQRKFDESEHDVEKAQMHIELAERYAQLVKDGDGKWK